MQENRRAFLTKALSLGAISMASASCLNAKDINADSNGVVVGRAKKKEVLYKKTLNWEKFYKIAY